MYFKIPTLLASTRKHQIIFANSQIVFVGLHFVVSGKMFAWIGRSPNTHLIKQDHTWRVEMGTFGGLGAPSKYFYPYRVPTSSCYKI